MEHAATIFVFRPEGAYQLFFQMPDKVDEGLRERNHVCWKGTIKYIETQIAAHRARKAQDGAESS